MPESTDAVVRDLPALGRVPDRILDEVLEDASEEVGIGVKLRWRTITDGASLTSATRAASGERSSF